MTSLLLAFLLFAPDDLPKGEDILAKYVEATGGRAAYEKIHGTISKGSMLFAAQNIKGTITVYESEPSRQVSIADFPGIGKMEEGTDGKVAWSVSAIQGARVKEGEEKAAAIRAANGENKFLNWKQFYKSIENKGVESIDGKDCYKIVFTPTEGKPEIEYYDKSSGLIVKQAAAVTTPMGEVPVTTVVDDYRKEGDILMPHKLRQTAAGQTFEITIDSVQFNPEFPKDRFDPPAEVKALLKK